MLKSSATKGDTLKWTNFVELNVGQKINFERHSVKLTQSNVGKGKKPFSTKTFLGKIFQIQPTAKTDHFKRLWPITNRLQSD